MHAVARLALTGYIDNVQASWIKMGPERAIQLMNVGCNDMGGSIMNETISKAAGRPIHKKQLSLRQDQSY